MSVPGVGYFPGAVQWRILCLLKSFLRLLDLESVDGITMTVAVYFQNPRSETRGKNRPLPEPVAIPPPRGQSPFLLFLMAVAFQ
jgi:hypothetical protein